MNKFVHENLIYEVVDEFEFDNNKKLAEIDTEELDNFNLPLAMLPRKKIIIKNFEYTTLVRFLKNNINLHYVLKKPHFKIKFEKLPISYKAWFLFIQNLFQEFLIDAFLYFWRFKREFYKEFAKCDILNEFRLNFGAFFRKIWRIFKTEAPEIE